MAKPKPTLQEMENALGYRVDTTVDVAQRIYSNFKPVSTGKYARTEMEYNELRKRDRPKTRRTHSNTNLPDRDETEIIMGEDNTIMIEQSNLVGFYKFFVDIQYKFGLRMSFLLTETEAYDVVYAARTRHIITTREESAKGALQQPKPGQLHTTLPEELRYDIYGFALQGGNWLTEERTYNICQAIGDPDGFSFPLGDEYTILQVNRQIRHEALPIAYRHIEFQLGGIEDLTRFLIAIGSVGRENIEILVFSWESEVDQDLNWRMFPDSETNHLKLPVHVFACVQLLKQCRRLRSLRLRFEAYMMEDVPEAIFMSDPGISSLCSIKVERVEIATPDDGSLQEHSIARWLKDQMTRQI